MAGLFDPWMMGQQFGGLLGGQAPEGITQKDIEALLRGYHTQADAPQIPIDPSGSTPFGTAQPNPYGNPSGLMPTQTATISTDAPQPPQQANGGSWIRPGSFLEKLIATAGAGVGGANAAPITAPALPPSLSSGAEPSAVWGGPAPQMANVPMPLPRPAPGVNLGAPAQQPGPPLSILPPDVNRMPPAGGAPQPPQIPPQAADAMAQTQPQGGGFLQGLSNFSHNLGSAPGLPGLIDAVRGTQTGQRYDAAGKAEQNQANMAKAIYGALQQRGIPPQQALAIATAASTDPKLAEQLLPQALGLKPPSTIEGVVAESLSGANRPGAGSVDLANNPVLKQWDERTARLAGQKTAAEETAKIQAPAKLALGPALAATDEQIRLVESVRSHPGRKGALSPTGMLGKFPAVPGTDGYDFANRLDQVKSGAFLQAFESLKGAGAITEVEGAKATAALARMDRATSDKEFDAALDDYVGVLKRGKDKAAIMAGQPGAAYTPRPPTPSLPAPPAGFRIQQ